MLVKLSSKGQLVIPKPVREALNLHQGIQFQIRVSDGDRIVLEPVREASPIESLYGKYAADDLLAALEQEHRREIAADG